MIYYFQNIFFCIYTFLVSIIFKITAFLFLLLFGRFFICGCFEEESAQWIRHPQYFSIFAFSFTFLLLNHFFPFFFFFFSFAFSNSLEKWFLLLLFLPWFQILCITILWLCFLILLVFLLFNLGIHFLPKWLLFLFGFW